MANESGSYDTMDVWKAASHSSISRVMNVNTKQMFALLRSMFCEGAEEKDIRQAIKQFGGSLQTWAKIFPMSPWPAVNAPSNTNMRGLTQSITRVVSDSHPTLAVATPGTWIIIDKVWCGVAVRTYGEIALGTPLVLPGAAPPSSTSTPNPPSLPTQIPFGPSSQSKPGAFASIYGAGGINYGIPAWMTPPPSVNGTLPAYDALNPSGQLWWAPTNGFLFNPGTLVPYVSSSAAQSATFSAIMLLRNGKDQVQNSEQLAALYSVGRRITAMKSLYLTANASGTSASGIGASCFSTDSRLYAWSPSVIESQGGKNSISQVTLVRANPAADQQGLRSIQGSNVDQIMGPLEYGLVGGGLTTRTFQIWSTLINASGIQPIVQTGSTVPQANGLPGVQNSIQNYMFDRQGDSYARVLWISDKTTNVGGTFQQTFSLAPNQCQYAGATGDAINNLYPFREFSTLSSTRDVNIENVQIELTNEDCPPVFTVSHRVAMGASCCGSMGNGCHVWAQIMSDDTVQYTTQPFGLSIWGLSGAGMLSGSATHQTGYCPYGVIPGGMMSTVSSEVAVPVQPGSFSFTRQWTWVGTFLCLTAMPNAQQEVSINISIPLENSPNVSGPVQVDRIDGASNGQQIVYSLRTSWEVLATGSTRAVTNKSGDILQPMIDPKFPDLLRNLFASGNSEFFKCVMDESSWMQRVFAIMTLDSPRAFLTLLSEQDFSGNPLDPIHERITSLVPSKVQEIEDNPLKRQREEEAEDEMAKRIKNEIGASGWFSDLTDKVANAVHHAKKAIDTAHKGYQLAKQAHGMYKKARGGMRADCVYDGSTGYNGDAEYGVNGDAEYGVSGNAPYDDEYKGQAFFQDDNDGANYLTSGSPNSAGGMSVPCSPWMSPLLSTLGLPLDYRETGSTLLSARSEFLKVYAVDPMAPDYFFASMYQLMTGYDALLNKSVPNVIKDMSTENLVKLIRSNRGDVECAALVLLAAGFNSRERSSWLVGAANVGFTKLIEVAQGFTNMLSRISEVATKDDKDGKVTISEAGTGSVLTLTDRSSGGKSTILVHPKQLLSRAKGGAVVLRTISDQGTIITTWPADYFLVIAVDANPPTISSTAEIRSHILTGGAARKLFEYPVWLMKSNLLKTKGGLAEEFFLKKSELKPVKQMTATLQRLLVVKSDAHWARTMNVSERRTKNVPMASNVLDFILQFTDTIMHTGGSGRTGWFSLDDLSTNVELVPLSKTKLALDRAREARPTREDLEDLEPTDEDNIHYTPGISDNLAFVPPAPKPKQPRGDNEYFPRINRLKQEAKAEKVKLEKQ